jgi:hypothetical protein
MPTVAIGPDTGLPSWKWIGPDTARELGRYFRVRQFRDAIPACDVAILIKDHAICGPQDLLRGPRLIYCPIDHYSSPGAIDADRSFLERCAAVLIHCERLRAPLSRLTRNIWWIDHHDKYALPRPAAYRESGFILWIGGFQYAPYVLRWVEDHPLPAPLKLLTDAGNPAAQRCFDELAKSLGLRPARRADRIDGHEVVPWSVKRQAQLLQTAKAAVDIKWAAMDFNQWTKPPTKAQQYLISGVPFAVNPESYSYEYFQSRGFRLATPDDPGRWLSEDYWRESLPVGAALRDEISLRSVVLRLKSYVERVL